MAVQIIPATLTSPASSGEASAVMTPFFPIIVSTLLLEMRFIMNFLRNGLISKKTNKETPKKTMISAQNGKFGIKEQPKATKPPIANQMESKAAVAASAMKLMMMIANQISHIHCSICSIIIYSFPYSKG